MTVRLSSLVCQAKSSRLFSLITGKQINKWMSSACSLRKSYTGCPYTSRGTRRFLNIPLCHLREGKLITIPSGVICYPDDKLLRILRAHLIHSDCKMYSATNICDSKSELVLNQSDKCNQSDTTDKCNQSDTTYECNQSDTTYECSQSDTTDKCSQSDTTDKSKDRLRDELKSIDSDELISNCSQFDPNSTFQNPQLHVSRPFDELISFDLNSGHSRHAVTNDLEIEDFTEEPEVAVFPGMEDDHKKEYMEPATWQRGVHGVFDLDDLVILLRENNLGDICVIRVPSQCQYVDHMVIGTCRSSRHLKAVAEIIRVMYKRKRYPRDPEFVKIEGADTNSWMAVDLGNIAIHLFLEESRELYDLESLWSLGEEYDDQSRMASHERSIIYSIGSEPLDDPSRSNVLKVDKHLLYNDVSENETETGDDIGSVS